MSLETSQQDLENLTNIEKQTLETNIKTLSEQYLGQSPCSTLVLEHNLNLFTRHPQVILHQPNDYPSFLMRQQEQECSYELVVLEQLPLQYLYDIACLVSRGGMFVYFLLGDQQQSFQQYKRITQMARKLSFRIFVQKVVELDKNRSITLCCCQKR